MDEADQHRLLIHREKILKDVRFSYVRDSLLTSRTLTTRNMEEIECLSSPFQQMSALLDLLPRKGPGAFGAFCKALENEYSWLVKDLQSAIVSQPTEERKRVREPYTELNHDVLSLVTKSSALKKHKDISRHLGLSEMDIYEKEYAHQNQLQEQFYQCLRKWMSKMGKLATVQILIDALRKEECNDIADKLDGYD